MYARKRQVFKLQPAASARETAAMTASEGHHRSGSYDKRKRYLGRRLGYRATAALHRQQPRPPERRGSHDQHSQHSTPTCARPTLIVKASSTVLREAGTSNLDMRLLPARGHYERQTRPGCLQTMRCNHF